MAVQVNRSTLALLMLTAIPCLTSCVNPQQSNKRHPAGGPGIGMIEHRGQFYRVEDLMNPDKRSKSSDRFMRGFGNDPAYASQWAGMNPEESWTRSRASESAGRLDPVYRLQPDTPQSPTTPSHSLEPFPWAGRNPEDLHD